MSCQYLSLQVFPPFKLWLFFHYQIPIKYIVMIPFHLLNYYLVLIAIITLQSQRSPDSSEKECCIHARFCIYDSLYSKLLISLIFAVIFIMFNHFIHQFAFTIICSPPRFVIFVFLDSFNWSAILPLLHPLHFYVDLFPVRSCIHSFIRSFISQSVVHLIIHSYIFIVFHLFVISFVYPFFHS